MLRIQKKYDSENITKMELVSVISEITGEDVRDAPKRNLIKHLQDLPKSEVSNYFTQKQLEYLNKKAKRRAPLPVFLTKEEIMKLVGAANSYQDKMMITFANHTGCRIDELVSTNAEDIDFARKSVRLRGKGRKERVVHLADNAFVQELKAFAGDKGGPLFISNRKERFKKRGLQKKIKLIARRAGLDAKKVSWHKLRHSYGVYAIERGVSVPSLSRQMGHSNPATTLIYTRLSDKMVRDEFDRLNPTALEKEGAVDAVFFCFSCGQRLFAEARFCFHCGAKQRSNDAGT
jgi:site-specific recombinase XerD